MMSNLTSHMTRELVDDRLRVAAERRHAEASVSHERATAHDRQLAFVLASLLFSRRHDAATHRR
jgi:hypothetical protein